MVKHESDMQQEIRTQMRGGEGEVEILHILKKEEVKGKTRLIARIRLKAGCSVGFHRHEQEEEIYYILSGKGQVDDNGKVLDIGPGDVIHTGDGAGHAIANTDSDPLEFMAIILLYG